MKVLFYSHAEGLFQIRTNDLGVTVSLLDRHDNHAAIAVQDADVHDLGRRLENAGRKLRRIGKGGTARPGEGAKSEVETLRDRVAKLEHVLNRVHAIGGIVAYSEGEWLLVVE